MKLNKHNNLDFNVSFSESILDSNLIYDLSIIFSFKNNGNKNIDIYPKAAEFSCVGGWGGPVLDIDIDKGFIKELRNWYGPPAQPPGSSYYSDKKKMLKPEESFKFVMDACWIPRKKLTDENLSSETLDPEGMDGLDADQIIQSSVIVMNMNKNDIIREMDMRPDFLRPGVIIFIPEPGVYNFKFNYRQNEWTGFNPDKEVWLKSNDVNLTIK